LAAQLGIAHVELDGLHHGPNWSEPSDAEFQARVQSAMDAHPGGWVIDGNYERKLGRLVTDAADLVVWLDLPLPLLLVRAPSTRVASALRDPPRVRAAALA
jgi:adenylate kinase family enzyme